LVPTFLDCRTVLAVGTSAAGNGIFCCRDGPLKIGFKERKRHRRPEEAKNTGENPRRIGLFAINNDFGGLGGLDGGRDRDRTCDPLDVNEVLSR
jgi:hypothetical protein